MSITKRPMDEPNVQQNEDGRKNQEFTSKTSNVLIRFLDKLIPPFAPLVNIESKLIVDEKPVDHVITRFFSEIQISLGMVFLTAGFLLIPIFGSVMIFGLMTGIILIGTGFQIEEIHLTSKRLLIRRIGLIERITRIPSDEEHLLNHIVSFSLGRAPPNMVFLVPVLIGISFIFTLGLSNFVIYLALIPLLIVLYFALRLGKRMLTLNFAGNHQVIVGVTKGIPIHLVNSLTSVIYDEGNFPTDL